MAMDDTRHEKIKAQMDEVDNKIMTILHYSGILETSVIAKRLGISIDETKQRLNKIKDLGLIGGFQYEEKNI